MREPKLSPISYQRMMEAVDRLLALVPTSAVSIRLHTDEWQQLAEAIVAAEALLSERCPPRWKQQMQRQQQPTAGAVLATLTRWQRFLAERGCICLHPDRERCEALLRQVCVCSCHRRVEYGAQEESDERA